MAKEPIDMRKELRSRKIEYNIIQKIPCTGRQNKEYNKLLKEGGSLPEGVFAYVYEGGAVTDEYYTIYESDFSQSEIMEYLAYKQLELTRTIKNCVVFFTVITVIGLILSALRLT